MIEFLYKGQKCYTNNLPKKLKRMKITENDIEILREFDETEKKVKVEEEIDDTWTYYGANSTYDKLIGWNYCVEWYNADGVCVASDLIRINLSNEDIHAAIEPYYMSKYVTTDEMNVAFSWGEL